MELTIPLIISIISIIFCVLSFAYARKNDNRKETSDTFYKQGVLETKIDNLASQVEKILNKLDGYDEEIEKKIDKALENHIKEYHKVVR